MEAQENRKGGRERRVAGESRSSPTFLGLDTPVASSSQLSWQLHLGYSKIPCDPKRRYPDLICEIQNGGTQLLQDCARFKMAAPRREATEDASFDRPVSVSQSPKVLQASFGNP